MVEEKKQVFGRELWKEFRGTYSTFQRVLGFLLLTCTEEGCAQRDLYKGTSQISLENMISSL